MASPPTLPRRAPGPLYRGVPAGPGGPLSPPTQAPPLRGLRLGAAVLVALVILASSAAASGYSAGNTAAALSFPFPFLYSAPVPPPTVGAQGHAGILPGVTPGPTSSLAALGAHSVGPAGSSNPYAWITAATLSTLEVQVKNGTTSSSVAGQKVPVAAENATTGAWVAGQTNTHGFVNLTLTEGYWYVFANSSSPSFESFVDQQDLASSSVSDVRYLLPSSWATVAVANCHSLPGTCVDAIWVSLTNELNALPTPQLDVELLNESSSGAVLDHSGALANGSVEFTEVNSAFSYEVQLVGLSQAQTGVKYWLETWASTSFSPTAHTVEALPVYGTDSSTATITGSALPAGGGPWSIAAPTTVSGGVLHLSSYPSYGGGASLTFAGTTVYVNSSQFAGASSLRVSAQNSTFILLAEGNWFQGTAQLLVNDSVLAGSAIGPSPARAGSEQLALAAASGSVFEWVSGAATYSDVGGTLSNCLLLNDTLTLGVDTTGARNSFSSVTIQGSNLTGQPGASSTADVFTGSYVNDSSFQSESAWFNSTNSAFYLVPQEGGLESMGFGAARGTLLHVTLEDEDPPGVNFTSFYHHQAITSTTGFGADEYGWLEFALPKIGNVSDSVFNISYPSLNVEFSAYSLSGWNDYLWTNYSIAELLQWNSLNPSTNPVKTGWLTLSAPYLYLNFTTFDLATIDHVGAANGGEFEHDVWPYQIVGDLFQPWQLLGNATHPANSAYVYQDDVFGYVYYNSTVSEPIEKAIYSPGGSNWIQDMNLPQPAPGGFINISQNTFESFGLGSGGNQVPSVITLGEQHVVAQVTGNLFENNPAYDLGPAAFGRTYAPPYQEDVGICGGVSYLTGNWFLNLNNLSVPIGTNDRTCNNQGSDPAVTLSGNEFFYAPLPSQAGVLAGGPIEQDQVAPGTPADPSWSYGGPLYSQATYVLPVGWNTSSFTVAGPQLVSNASLLQVDPQPQGRLGTGYENTSWSWSVAPDVSTASGTATVSFAAGGEGGPQPNFFWRGYNYSEDVEPTYAELGANSTRAPAVELTFSNLVPGATYSVTGYSPSTLAQLSIASSQASSLGTVTVTYSPSAGYLAEVFSVACPGTCAQGGAASSSGFLGLPLIVWVGIAGVAIAAAIGAEVGRRRG